MVVAQTEMETLPGSHLGVLAPSWESSCLGQRSLVLPAHRSFGVLQATESNCFPSNIGSLNNEKLLLLS